MGIDIGTTFRPGWGTHASMEYRLQHATEEECLEWAQELWQLELVAQVRGMNSRWARRVMRAREAWAKLPRTMAEAVLLRANSLPDAPNPG